MKLLKIKKKVSQVEIKIRVVIKITGKKKGKK